MRLSRDSAEALAGRLAGGRELEPLRGRIASVFEAIAIRRPPAQVERLADSLAASIWDDGLRAAAAAGLERMREDALATLERVEAAEAELERPARGNRLAPMLILSLGLRMVHEAQVVESTLEEADAELERAPAADQRLVALRWAGTIVASRGDIPRDELGAAASQVNAGLAPHEDEGVADAAARALAAMVATPDRRKAARNAASDLALACAAHPVFAAVLTLALAEPAPDDPGDDDVWVSTVMASLAQIPLHH